MSVAGKRVLPGFNITLGYTLVYLSLLVLIPLSATFIKSASLTLDQFWAVVTSPRVVASYKLSFGASLIAAGINAVFGLLLAWQAPRDQARMLARSEFGRLWFTADHKEAEAAFAQKRAPQFSGG